MLASIRGKALSGGRVLVATDEGLLLLDVDAATGQFREGVLFEDTEPFVSADVDLVPMPGGAIIVATTKEIMQLTLT